MSTVLQRLKLGTIKTQSTTQWRSLKLLFALTSGQQLYKGKLLLQWTKGYVMANTKKKK